MTGLVIDLFAGPGGWSQAARTLGILEVGIELDAAACATRAAAGLSTVRADVAAFPVEHLDGRCWGLIGSPPCFPAGTPVLTAQGVMAIEQVRVGDLVLTHRGRWRFVTRTSSKHAQVYADRWLTATRDHRFYSREQSKHWDNDRRAYSWDLGEASWTEAADLHGRYIALPAHAEPLPIPSAGVEMGIPFWYMVGRWLGDGWVRLRAGDHAPQSERATYSREQHPCPQCGKPAARHARYDGFRAYCSDECKDKSKVQAAAQRRQPRADVTICCAKEEADGLSGKLADTGLAWRMDFGRTTARFTVSKKQLTEWLDFNFGRHAHGKTLPGWAFGMPREQRAALLDGYLDADGSVMSGGWSASTVSQNLAIGIRLLATGLGYTTSLGYKARESGIIEGRPVNQRPSWRIGIIRDDGRYTLLDELHRWVKQRKPLTGSQVQEVFDLTVDEDHSFTAHGFVVHNCTTFSAAGDQAGNQLMALLSGLIRDMFRGRDSRAAHREAMAAELSRSEWSADSPPGKRASKITAAVTSAVLVAEPARFIHACRPEWVALEQVPAVLPLWQVYADELRRMGYSTWTGKLNSADYGVPQTRERAILIASRVRRVSRPEPTHYDPRKGAQLWGEPWVTMAAALGWGADERPAVAVTAGGTSTGGAEPFGNRGRAALEAERDAGRWTVRTSFGTPSETPGNGTHEMDPSQRPAHAVTTKAGSWTLRTNRGQRPDGSRQTVDPSAAPALTAKSGGQWVYKRPATTVQGDPRAGRPGHKDREGGERQFAQDSVRCTVEELAAPQSFPPGYPWQGTKTKRQEQIGNAVPPLLAEHVLSMATGLRRQERAA